jgi:hypothetical protein
MTPIAVIETPYLKHLDRAHAGGNLVEALAKLKHSWGLYSSIPVLVTRAEQIPDAENLLSGSFHEIKDVTRILTDDKLAEFYQLKIKFKDLKNVLGIV